MDPGPHAGSHMTLGRLSTRRSAREPDRNREDTEEFERYSGPSDLSLEADGKKGDQNNKHDGR
jgi:hypothetical protein